MLKLIVGVKGTGKTKALIEMVNAAAEKTVGSVACIEQGNKLRFDIKSAVRLLDVTEYMIDDAEALFGYIAGIYASNHDITEIFVDSALKICRDDMTAFETFVLKLEAFSNANGINLGITASTDISNIPDSLKKFI
ncbi:MAG: hypothetical protein J5922_00975 [Clostridia bacterium]|nr:hypothetical protein [Clostridia bacterium]